MRMIKLIVSMLQQTELLKADDVRVFVVSENDGNSYQVNKVEVNSLGDIEIKI